MHYVAATGLVYPMPGLEGRDMVANHDGADTVSEQHGPTTWLHTPPGLTHKQEVDPVMSLADPIPTMIPEASALRPEWDDLHGRLEPLQRALCELLDVRDALQARTMAAAFEWAEGLTGRGNDAGVDLFCAVAGHQRVDVLLCDLAAQF